MPRGDEVYDALVIGSGAAGAWAAKELAEAGLGVLVLEAGPFAEETRGVAAPRRRYAIQSTCEAFNDTTSGLFADDIDSPYTTDEGHPFAWIRARAVGGRMLLWDGVCLRMSDADFKRASVDGFGEDWPIGQADLAEAYAKVEQAIGVRGSCEGLASLPDGSFLPPVPLNPLERAFKAGVEARCGERSVIPMRIAARPHRVVLEAALASGRVIVRANAVCTRIEVDAASGLASEVTYVDRLTNEKGGARGRVVIVCASTIESARLLLHSRSARFPDGLANSSGLVGRYLFDHTFLSASFRCRPPPEVKLDAPLAAGRCYVPRFDQGESRGYGIEVAISAPDPAAGTCDVDVAVIGEVVPRYESRVTLRTDAADAWGVPVPHVSYAHTEPELAAARRGLEALRGMLEAARFDAVSETSKMFLPGLSVHEMGTARMGSHRAKSVLSPFNQAWDCANLFVTDASAFVSGGSQNPTMTIMALTVRACGQILREMRRGSF